MDKMNQKPVFFMYVIYFDTEFHENCALIFYKTFSNLLIKEM